MIEKEVLIQAQNGIEEAIEQIINEHKLMIYKNTKSFFLKDGDFNDLMQEGYIGLLKAIQCYDETKDASFETFEHLSMRRQMITAIKKSNSDKYKTLTDAMYNESYSEKEEKINYTSPSLGFYNPEEILLGKELFVLLNNYLSNNLSSFEKKVFYYLLKQQTYIEISEHLNENPKKIDNTIQRIKKKIRLYLQRYATNKKTKI